MVQERTQAFAAQPLYDALDSGRPIVAALPHMGNWDLCGLWFTQQFRPISSVAERLNPASLFDRFVEFRKSLGIEIFAHHSTPDVYQRLIEALRKGRLVALVADRDLSKLGVDVEFFGAPTKMPAGPAALTIDTDAVLLPVSLWHKGEIVYGQPFEPIQLPASGDRSAKIAQMTQQLARSFESAISSHPSDWYMLQRVWDDPLLPRGGRRLHQ
jgi:KDO2-lipid IV(A) lauroyltransferase